MDKKKILIVILFVVVVVAAGFGIYLCSDKKDSVETDAMKFKREYEALNGETAYGDSVYQTLDLDENNKVNYADLNEAVEFLEEGTGIIYFGFPNCPWCRGILPTLLDVVQESKLDKILYVDMTEKRDTFVVEDKKAVKTKDASEEYYKLLDILDEYLDEYTVKEEGSEKEYKTGEKRMYVPLVAVVKDGVVKEAVTSPVKLEKNQTAFDALSKKQIEDLEKLFKEMIKKTEDAVCDGHC